MKSTDMTPNGVKTDNRANFDSTVPSGGISNVSQADNSKVLMNKPEMDTRGSRADALVDTMSMDSYRLGTEAPRMGKIKG